MSTALRLTLQSAIAGVVAAGLILAGLNLVSEAQETAPEEETSVQDTGPALPACNLVTMDEAVATLGAEATVVDDPGQCTYVASDLTGRAVSVATVPPSLTADSLGTSMEQMAGALNAELRTAAVGDEAYLVLSESLTQIAARSGDDIIIIVLTTSSDTIDEQAATLSALATTALSRV